MELEQEQGQSLLSEIKERGQEISTDSYSMSVGELIAIYKAGELDLSPEFQRFYRWTPEQKVKFVESMLLGIPIPPIFVAQKESGKWEVVDGVQRLSTLFETAGELRKGKDNRKMPPLQLTKTKYLPSLEGMVWESEEPQKELPEQVKLQLRRARLDINIVLSKSAVTAKYELFQRLNTGSAIATDQEVRNAMLARISPNFFEWLTALGSSRDFKACLPLTEKAENEQFPLELVTRFLVLRKLSLENIRELSELGTFLDDHIAAIALDPTFAREETERAFTRTFEVLSRTLGKDSFKRYDIDKEKALGSLIISIYEVLAIGLGHFAGNPDYEIDEELILSVHRQIGADPRFIGVSKSGVRASSRLPVTIEMGRGYFAP